MAKKKLKPIQGKYKQGYYQPRYPEKYLGDAFDIVYRSGWERKIMMYCDYNANILNWSSEPVEIPYFDPIDKKIRRYIVDFYIKLITKDGTIKEYLAEVKPKAQIPTEKPVYEGEYITAAKMTDYKRRMRTYIINKAKFTAGINFAKMCKKEFIIITEDFINW